MHRGCYRERGIRFEWKAGFIEGDSGRHESKTQVSDVKLRRLCFMQWVMGESVCEVFYFSKHVTLA